MVAGLHEHPRTFEMSQIVVTWLYSRLTLVPGTVAKNGVKRSQKLQMTIYVAKNQERK
jgi:hypothetical protein